MDVLSNQNSLDRVVLTIQKFCCGQSCGPQLSCLGERQGICFSEMTDFPGGRDCESGQPSAGINVFLCFLVKMDSLNHL